MGNVVALGGVNVIGGSVVPVVDTFKPGLIICPSMIVAPRLTTSGPTLGGTNVSRDGACEMDGAVAALATPADAVRHNALSAAAATGSLGKCTFISLWTIDGRAPAARRGSDGPRVPFIASRSSR
jgi:hypothetical protein